VSLNPLVYAAPVFFALIGLEWIIARRLGKPSGRLADSASNIGTGVLQTSLGTFTGLFTLIIYENLRRTCSLELWPNWGAGSWVLGLLLVDLAYYWAHRCCHEWNIGWATHAVHHQSEEYNLSVALRQGAAQNLVTFWFYLPLAVIGLPTAHLLILKAIDTFYQFWIHSRLIGRLGPLEWVVNTPSHHRVHHARNDPYIDKNYGGILIIWDRLFGTFEREQKEPLYGVREELASWNPVWANLAVWAHIGRMMSVERRFFPRLRLLFRGPAWLPEGMHVAVKADDDPSCYDPPWPLALKVYNLAQTALIVAFGLGQLAAPPELLGALAGLLWIGFSLSNLAGISEGRRWAPLAEFSRILLTPVLLFKVELLGGWSISGLWPSLGLIFVGALWAALWLTVLAECRSHFLVKVRPLPLDDARLAAQDWSERQRIVTEHRPPPGDAAAEILAGRWS
jgi:alkylglycerol monooxygenase